MRNEKVKIFIEFLAEDFPCSTGLLADGLMLFARSVIVIDPKGIVRYIQVVPEMSHLPDMDKAFEKAIDLAK